MLNLLEMRVFTVAADTENFSETARRLHLSQPAVSQRIRSLERHLGTRLFRRCGRSVELTDAGRVLLPMARELLETMRQIEETMLALEGEVAGQVIIGCTTTAGKYALPLLAASFNQDYPKVLVTIEMCRCDSVEQPLLAREVHVGISDRIIVHRDMECQPFFTDQIVLIVPADHPFSGRSSVQPLELLDQPFILREEGCSTCRMVEEGLAEHQIHLDQLHAVMSVGNSEAIELAVEHGLGIAFISRLAAMRGIESGRLVEVPVEGLRLERLLHVVRNARCPKAPAEAMLWGFVREHRGEIAQMLEI
ncbi:MAG: LysR family transcriptional regulator [Anaerolineae bacterium]|jgi:DNA-binding transcriptional LysR family regulator